MHAKIYTLWKIANQIIRYQITRQTPPKLFSSNIHFHMFTLHMHVGVCAHVLAHCMTVNGDVFCSAFIAIFLSPDLTYSWSRVGGVLPEGRHEQLSSNTVLKLRNLQQDDEGFYICQADNLRGRQTTTIQVVVEGIKIFQSALTGSSL